MNDILKQLISKPLPDTEREILQLLRESLQSLALLALWRSNFFEHAAFYGGTALRILYGLDRFSEDLDFSLLKPDHNFTFDKYSGSIIRELEAFGFKVNFEVKKKNTNSEIESAFIKTNTLQQLIVIETPSSITSQFDKQKILKVKLEIDTNPPPGFNTEMKYVFSPIQFAVKSLTLPSLFAGKMHAMLCRKWISRVKGRDWYDFIWYISKHPELNLKHLEIRMRQSGDYSNEEVLTELLFREMLNNAIDKLDVEKAKNEVEPFVDDKRSLDLWSKEFLKAAAEKIIIV